MVKLAWAMLIGSTAQFPIAYGLGWSGEVWYVTALSIIALQYAAVTAINSAKADKHAKENGSNGSTGS